MKKQIVNPRNPYFGQVLEYVAPSPLDNWGAVILRIDSNTTAVFRESEFKTVKS